MIQVYSSSWEPSGPNTISPHSYRKICVFFFQIKMYKTVLTFLALLGSAAAFLPAAAPRATMALSAVRDVHEATHEMLLPKHAQAHFARLGLKRIS